jgi:serine phosphatase RsbU (regulator of sigma subunit)
MAFAARYVSASGGAAVGGDLYEVAYSPSGVRLIVGDVQGKGLEAVALASTVLGSFRSGAYDCERLADLAAFIDEQVSKETGDYKFVTAALLQFPVDHYASVVLCGHVPPLLIAETSLQYLDGTVSLPLGTALDAHPDFAEQRFRFEPGDRLLAYTDGLTEARDATEAFFDLVDHLDAVRNLELQAAVDYLVNELTHHVGKITDDVAIVLCEHLGT